MNKIAEQIGLRLRAARRKAGYRSARKFASQHDIPESTYSQHETGKRSLNPETMLRYSELLNINSAWLLTGEGNLQSLKDSQENVTAINPILFTNIFRTIIKAFSHHGLTLGYEKLISFCIEVYNNIISRADNVSPKECQDIIELSVSSLKRSMEEKAAA